MAAIFYFDRKDFNHFFLSTSRPDISYQVSSLLAFQKKTLKIDFSSFSSGGHLGYLERNRLAILVESRLGNVPVTEMGQ